MSGIARGEESSWFVPKNPVVNLRAELSCLHDVQLEPLD